MGTESIVSHIPNLDAEARQLAERMKGEPKNRYGIPLYRLQPRERHGVEKTDTFCRKANMHIIQLIHEAEAAHERGYLVEFPEVNDPWEQDQLQRLVKEMNSKGTSVTRYPWSPDDVLYVDDLIKALKNIISESDVQPHGEAEENPMEATTDATLEEKVEQLEMNVAAIMVKLGIAPNH